MMRSGRSIRLADIAQHPSSVGFPAGHPPMRSFLGVPVAAYGRSIGQIYLTDKRDSALFTEEDQNLIELLAAHAAAAIENARLYQAIQDREAELRQRNEELELSNTLTSAASTSVDVDQLLELILDRTAGAVRSEGGGDLPARGGREHLCSVRASRSAGRRRSRRRRIIDLGEGIIGLVAETGQPYWTDRLESRAAPGAPGSGAGRVPHHRVCAVSRTRRVLGVLTLAFLGARPILEREVRLLMAIGGGVGIVLENARLLRQARRLAVLEERERIGMDLHDGIIQSIYAVGLTLEFGASSCRRLASRRKGRTPSTGPSAD